MHYSGRITRGARRSLICMTEMLSRAFPIPPESDIIIHKPTAALPAAALVRPLISPPLGVHMSSLRMRTFRRVAGAVVVLLTLAWPGQSKAADAAPEPEDLHRGLVTVFTDKAAPPVEIVRLEPTIAVALQADEAAHPRLRPDGGTVVWKGYINVIRSGNYHFQANLRGKFRMTVGGKEVLTGDVPDEKPQLKEGADLRLDAGVVPLVAEYTRPAGAARVEVFWQGPGFRLEPLPFDVLGHLPAQATPQLEHDARARTGAFSRRGIRLRPLPPSGRRRIAWRPA